MGFSQGLGSVAFFQVDPDHLDTDQPENATKFKITEQKI